MTKVIALLGRKLADVGSKEHAAPAAGAKRPAEAGTGFVDMGGKLGQEHEALRAMLDVATRRIEGLDLVKDAYGRLIEPIGKAMQALEQEKVHNAALQSLLNGMTEAHDKQRSELAGVKQRAGLLEATNATLRSDLERMQDQLRMVEAERLELSDDLLAKRDRLASLELQYSEESAECRRLAEDCGTLSLRLEEGQKRVAQAEAEAGEAREKRELAEAELGSLRKSLAESVDEAARLSRRVSETQGELVAANAEIAKLDAALEAATTERDRLASVLDDANSQHQAESQSLTIRCEALQSRALSAEKLLEETRQALAVRTEEMRSVERGNAEAAQELDVANKKAEEQEIAVATLKQALRESEQDREAMAERNNGLTRDLRGSKAALTRATESIQVLTDRIAKLEVDAEERAAARDKQLEDVNATLQRERMERSMVEGALETVRRDYAVLQHDYAALTDDAPAEKRAAAG